MLSGFYVVDYGKDYYGLFITFFGELQLQVFLLTDNVLKLQR